MHILHHVLCVHVCALQRQPHLPVNAATAAAHSPTLSLLSQLTEGLGLCAPLMSCRYGSWEQLLAQTPPPRDARGVTAYGGPQFASVVYHAGRCVRAAPTCLPLEICTRCHYS